MSKIWTWAWGLALLPMLRQTLGFAFKLAVGMQIPDVRPRVPHNLNERGPMGAWAGLGF